MHHLILPLTKSPHPTGRIGPAEKQDWFKGLVKAKELLLQFPNSHILVLSNVHVAGEEHEVELYLAALKKLGVRDENIRFVREAQETMEQIEIARDIAIRHEAKLVVVSTWLHYMRVRWLMRGVDAKHYIAFGRPRLREAFTDIVLIVLFPILDYCFSGFREWFKTWVVHRRKYGKH